MALYDSTLGIELVASWVNSLLHMLVLSLAWDYFNAFSRDSRLLQAGVVACLVADTVSTVSGYALVYHYIITNFGQRPGNIIIEEPIIVLGGLISSTITRVFLVSRYWKSAQNKIITAVLILAILCTAAGIVATAVEFITLPARAHSAVSVHFSTIATVVCQLLISIALTSESRKQEDAQPSDQWTITRIWN